MITGKMCISNEEFSMNEVPWDNFSIFQLLFYDMVTLKLGEF